MFEVELIPQSYELPHVVCLCVWCQDYLECPDLLWPSLWLCIRSSCGQAGSRGSTSRSPPGETFLLRSVGVRGRHILIQCCPAPLAWVGWCLHLLACLPAEKLLLRPRSQKNEHCISHPASTPSHQCTWQHAQLCLRLWPLTSLPRTLPAGKPVASLQPGKRTSRLAGYSSPLSLPLSQFKFLATWSLKILSGGLWGQNPFHNDTRIWFFFHSFSHDCTVKFSSCYMTCDGITALMLICNAFIIVICKWTNM